MTMIVGIFIRAILNGLYPPHGIDIDSIKHDYELIDEPCTIFLETK